MKRDPASWKFRIHEWMLSHREEGTSLLQDIVRMPSTQGNEREAQLLIADKLLGLGMDVEMWEPDGEALEAHPFFHSPRSRFTGSPNVVGLMRGTGGGRSIILNGHMDVVPE
jgi:acetylornithine deacetylase